MCSEQVGYEGYSQRRGEEVAQDQAEVHDNEEKCKIQAYIMVTILQVTGKKTLHSAGQEP